MNPSCTTDCNNIIISTYCLFEFRSFCGGEMITGTAYVGSFSVGGMEIAEGGEDVEHFSGVASTA